MRQEQFITMAKKEREFYAIKEEPKELEEEKLKYSMVDDNKINFINLAI